MGVINTTPDSFYPHSRVADVAAAIDAVAAMLTAGGAIVDVGGESTRPGSGYVGADEEAARVVPVVEAIRSRWDAPISVDTRKASVARAAIDAGADMVNDVSALYDDPDLAPLCAERGVPVVLMHKKGVPANMQDAPWYDNCVGEVREFLVAAAERAIRAGIAPDSIVVDPGIGFGKRLDDNLALLARLDELSSGPWPVLVGLSRKSFIGAITGLAAEERLPGSLAAACAARARGAVIFRVHDVAETVAALAVFDAAFRGTTGRAEP
ncbi:MAG: dihydropteroate synthase [Spirochaetales bacterium]|nr:dihydropteroate synthase [Spirochaetales bacterium]